MQATYRLGFQNVKFVAIYDGGQAGGLKVKVGRSKFTSLAQPLIFTDRLGAKFGVDSSVVLQNESPSPRTAIMLVGWDLPNEKCEVRQIKVAAASARAPAAKIARKGRSKRAAKRQ